MFVVYIVLHDEYLGQLQSYAAIQPIITLALKSTHYDYSDSY